MYVLFTLQSALKCGLVFLGVVQSLIDLYSLVLPERVLQGAAYAWDLATVVFAVFVVYMAYNLNTDVNSDE